MELPARIGPYKVEKRLGSGSFAIVWLARDERLDALVAVKVLAENWAYNDDVKSRFIDEARILWRLSDDRIVRVHAVSELDDGRPYFVMEYADRGSLEDRMNARRTEGVAWPVPQAIAVSREIAACLTVAHDEGVVHRDLKPSNVLYRAVPPHRQRRAHSSFEQLLLADFGIARRLEAATAYTIAAGTPQFMAPEQADPQMAGKSDGRSDIYAAAVILYELLSGRVPFPYDSLPQILKAQQTEMPRPIRELRADVSLRLEEVIARGLQPDPDDRFPTAEEWDRALAGALEPEPPATRVVTKVPPAHLEMPGGSVLPLRAGSFTIGRAEGNDIVLDDFEVSRRHAKLTVSESGEAEIEDLGSMNGVVIGGEVVSKGSLAHGQSVQLGMTVLAFQKHPDGDCARCREVMPSTPR